MHAMTCVGKYPGGCVVELTPVVVNQMKPGGIYITSGDHR